ncbi:MAG: hypothetical protein WAL34_04095 [Acidobacteriaceae bacterium]
MTDEQPNQMGYGKASGPPIAVAITEIFVWALQAFANTQVPVDIQLDFAAVIGMLLVIKIPHDLFSTFTKGVSK